MKKRILVLDASTVKTGVSVFNGTDLIHFSLIDTKGIKDPDERLYYMCDEIEKVIARTKPTHVVLEDIQMQRGNIQVVIRLARLQGALMMLIHRHNLDWTVYKASKWRKLVGISGGRGVKRSELKDMAIDYVKASYGISPGEDVCESICMGLAHLRATDVLPDLDMVKLNFKEKDLSK